MAKLGSAAAYELATHIRKQIVTLNIIEARMFTTYKAEELPHYAMLALYSEPSEEELYDNVFRGDNAILEVDLSLFGYERTNKRFINSLLNNLNLDWCYMSVRRQLDQNTQGYHDVSARFNFANLMAILP